MESPNRFRFSGICLLDANLLLREVRGELPGETPPSGEFGRSNAPGDSSLSRLLWDITDAKLLLLLRSLAPLPVISSPSVIFESPPQLTRSSSMVIFTVGLGGIEAVCLRTLRFDFSLAERRIRLAASGKGGSLWLLSSLSEFRLAMSRCREVAECREVESSEAVSEAVDPSNIWPTTLLGRTLPSDVRLEMEGLPALWDGGRGSYGLRPAR